MIAHDKPFAQLSCAGHTEGVAKGGLRPPLSKRWPEPLRLLLRECWEAEAAKRPTFAELLPRLRGILRDIEKAKNDADLEKTIGCFDQLRVWRLGGGLSAQLVPRSSLPESAVDKLAAGTRSAFASTYHNAPSRRGGRWLLGANRAPA